MKRKSDFYDYTVYSDRYYKKRDITPILGAVGGAARNASNVVSLFNVAKNAGISAAGIDAMFGGAAVGESILAGAAVGALGSVAAGAGLGYLAGQAITSMFTQTNLNQIQSIMPGTYQGKFALSARSAFKGLRDQYQKKGAVFIVENFGQVSDPDLVYIGHSTWNLEAVSKAISIALLRKLFRVGVNLDPQTINEELALINPLIPDSGPLGFKIYLELRDSDGTKSFGSTLIPNDATLESLASLTGLVTTVTNAMTNANVSVLERVSLYEQGTPERLVYQMDMTKEVLNLAMSSHMVVQNRTKAASGDTNNLDVVDTQPLKGPVYEFSIGVPKLKAESPINLNQMENEGIVLTRAAQFAGTDAIAYKEPPVKNAFQKCVKSGFVRLNPGALKSMTVGTDIKGYYANVMFRLRLNNQNTQTKNCYGKSQLVCLEEELNSGSTNNILVQYECQHIAGAQFTTTSNPNMQPGYTAAAINNVPA